MAIEHCKGNANGLGLVNQGKEHTLEELGDYDESKIKRVSHPLLIRLKFVLTQHKSIP